MMLGVEQYSHWNSAQDGGEAGIIDAQATNSLPASRTASLERREAEIMKNFMSPS